MQVTESESNKDLSSCSNNLSSEWGEGEARGGERGEVARKLFQYKDHLHLCSHLQYKDHLHFNCSQDNIVLQNTGFVKIKVLALYVNQHLAPKSKYSLCEKQRV